MLQVVQRNNARRRYRARLRVRLQDEPAVRLMPALLDLPLRLSGDNNLEALSATVPRLALRGSAGSGRSLALAQLAWAWGAGKQSVPVVHVCLDQLDDGATSPHALMHQALFTAGLIQATAPHVRAPVVARCRLLLDAWETLAPKRQSLWRNFVLMLPDLWPEVRVLLVLPETALPARWPDFHFVDLLPPDPALLQTWFSHLLSGLNPDPLLAVLAPGAALAGMPRRLLEIALLCLSYTTSGFPASHAQLYENALTVMQQGRTRVAPLPWSDHPPPMAGTMPVHPENAPVIGAAGFHWYTRAVQLAAGALTDLADLPPSERGEVALLLTSMLPDPEPLLAVLWNDAPGETANLPVLARCLVECPSVPLDWWVRIMTTLVERQDQPGLQQLLHDLAPRFQQVLLTHAGALPEAPLIRLLPALAACMGAPRMLTLLDTGLLQPAVRWAAAEALLRLPAEQVLNTAQFAGPPDALAQAARCYLLAAAPAGCVYHDNDRFSRWVAALAEAPADREHRLRIVRQILTRTQLPVALHMAVLAVAPDVETPTVREILCRALADTDPAIRRMARDRLRTVEPQQALLVLSHLLLTDCSAGEAQYEAIEHLAAYDRGEASVLLARCAMTGQLLLACRLLALQKLAVRPPGGPVLLRRLLLSETMPAAVRGIAARLLTERDDPEVFRTLCRLARCGDVPVLVRQEALRALGYIGRDPGHRQAVLAVMGDVLEHVPVETVLVIEAIQVLGAIGAAESVAVLACLPNGAAAQRVQAAWFEHAPGLAELPVDQWHSAVLPTAVRLTLLTALAEGETSADRPGDLCELVRRRAEQVGCAAAAALAQIGRRCGGSVRESVHAHLLEAFCTSLPGPEAICLLHGLAFISANDPRHDLEYLLRHTRLDPALRWLAVEQLGAYPATATFLIEYLERRQIDPFVSGKIIEIVGRQRLSGAFPVLRHIIQQRDNPLHLRQQAIKGTGSLAEPAAETFLLDLVCDEQTPAVLRAAAAEALPGTLAAALRVRLRDMLLGERHQVEVQTSVIRALGRMHDHDALALMMRYAQHDLPVVATAALRALALIGDPSMAPLLVELAQRATLDQHIRLHAVGTLLRLCGDEYLPLLRRYLDSPVLPIQLQALDYLLLVRPSDARVPALLVDESAPLAIRLRAVEVTAQQRDFDSLGHLLLNQEIDTQVRVYAARLLGRQEDPVIVPLLTRCVCDAATPLRVRYQGLLVLAAWCEPDHTGARQARLALSQIADDPAQPEENRAWATQALLGQLTFLY